ncbi:MAG: UDP-2,4-diacetamido-2,4,6-trideoxy-beta-L-altropyranose hydrolase [Chitinophagaceae bacterium]|nr:MAG: UDP-2,4-diacetamido-2,4,6-trideoxy-beta-L-altropyranose hydrolase [Chitinophagaceae bacterium]
MVKPVVFFRADGSNTMGLGHITRCSALAEILRGSFRTILLTGAATPVPVIDTVRQSFNRIEQVPDSNLTDELAFVAETIGAGSIVVLDGYHFGTAYQRTVRQSGCLLVCIDDICQGFFEADVVINTSGHVSPADYRAAWFTRLYLGPAYRLLRKPFWQPVDANKTVGSVLINFGGADPGNQTLRALEQCVASAPDHSYEIVIGAAYQFKEELYQSIRLLKANVRVHESINAQQVYDLMASCEFAVTAPSTVSYEYLTTGGKLFLQVIADNQVGMFAWLVSKGYAKPFDVFPAGTYARLEAGFVDELRKIFSRLATEQTVRIREVLPGDVHLTYDWYMDQEVRRQSYSEEIAGFDQHSDWFARRVHPGPAATWFIAMHDDVAIGQARFDIQGKIATIGYLVDQQARGNGFAPIIIKKAIQRLTELNSYLSEVRGYVKNQNHVSGKAFLNLGFTRSPTTEYPDSSVYVLKITHENIPHRGI